jgi:hypothetical protein
MVATPLVVSATEPIELETLTISLRSLKFQRRSSEATVQGDLDPQIAAVVA